MRSQQNTTRILQLIEHKLKMFSFKLNSFGKDWEGNVIEPHYELAKHIIPSINAYKCLEILELYCPS